MFELDRVRGAVPIQRRDLREQLQRASSSIVLNIAEGASEFSPADKARFYRIARRSAAESASILDILDRLGSSRTSVDDARGRLGEVVAMLTPLSKARNRE